MNCPSCNRILASTLSVCPSCGTMVHDSVREELALKISPIIKTAKTVTEEKFPPVSLPLAPVIKPPAPTTQITSKPTSPTLADFQNKNAAVPDWRLQLQNSVRKRIDGHKTGEPAQPLLQTFPQRVNLVTSGANALQSEAVEENEAVLPANLTVKNALKRIEESRRKYLLNEPPIAIEPPVEQSTIKQFPILPKTQESLPKPEETMKAPAFLKANVVQFSHETKAEKFDTNKLPPLPLPAKISSSFEKRPLEPQMIRLEIEDDDFLEIEQTYTPEVTAYGETERADYLEEIDTAEEIEEVDDYAPLTLRFNAALFDLLVCSFLSLVLLAPFMMVNGRFFSFEGFFALLATCSIVMFIYMTTTIGFLGRTFGMRIFSLEMVDVEENDYPTLHQAAVSSSVYLLSLALGGAGFLTMLINREKRAAHDLLSGTIIVKEY